MLNGQVVSVYFGAFRLSSKFGEQEMAGDKRDVDADFYDDVF